VRALAVLLLLLPRSGAGSASQEGTEVRVPQGAPSAFDLSAPEETLVVAAGVRVRREPAAGSPPLVTVDATTELPVLERREGWVRVRYLGWAGWVPAAGREPAAAAGHAASLAVQSPAAAPLREVPDPDLLALALARLLEPAWATTLGPFALHTDAPSGRLVDRLRAVGESLPESYSRRFGLTVDGPRGAVVLYASEGSYRAYAAAADHPALRTARGHARAGVAALFVGSEGEELLPALLIHELTHLLNGTAIGSNLPAWLEEGLANDLASSRIEPDGRLALGTWGGASTVQNLAGRGGGVIVQQRGALASRRQLLEAWRRRDLTPLAELLEQPWEIFVAEPRRSIHYNQATAVVRYLLDGEDGALADPFRAYLGDLADGAVPDMALLERALGRSVAKLQRGFDTWLARQAILGAS
jgi:hypothetical protein